MNDSIKIKSGGDFDVVFPLLLVNLGILLLSINLQYFDWSVFERLVNWWPLILIFTGLELISGKNRIYKLGLGLVMIFTFWSLVFNSAKTDWFEQFKFPQNNQSQSNSKLLRTQVWESGQIASESAKPIDLKLEFPLGELNLDSSARASYRLQADLPSGIELSSEESETDTTMSYYVKPSADRRFSFGQDWKVDVNLPEKIPTNQLSINFGLGASELDLRRLSLSQLEYKQGIGPVRLKLSSEELLNNSEIELGIGSIVIEINKPNDLQLSYQVGIGSVVANHQTQSQGLGLSGQYGSGLKQINIKLGIGRVEILELNK